MRNLPAGLTAAAMLACALPATVHAADDPTMARAKEMLHRTQEALRQAQSDNADLARAKADAEQKLQAATQQIQAAQSGSKSAQAALNAKLTSVQGVQAELEHKLGNANAQLAATNAKLGDSSKQLAARESELAQVKQMLEQSKTANASCEDKNLKLYSYAEAVLERYKNKGVWASLAQKEPVFGFKEVGVENVVQEYRLKFAAERVKP
jgi:chromosome segregation ATPase